MRAVARLPATVRTKLLVAFAGTVVLLIVVVALALRVLGDSNERVAQLGALQQRATAYRELQTDAAHVRLLLGLRAGGADLGTYTGSAGPTGGSLAVVDQAIVSTLARPGRATDLSALDFTPPADEEAELATIGADFSKFGEIMDEIIARDQAGDAAGGLALQRRDGERLANELVLLTGQLADAAQAKTDAQVVANEQAFRDSRSLFVTVALASVVLALLVGLVLAWSVSGPLRRVEARLAQIAAGDFSEHVEVANRDELGALASNINRMNDELGRLYAEVETASRNKSDFLANMSHELRTPLNAIIGFSQVLQDRMFGELNERQSAYVGDVLTSGQHLLSLINDILDLAKVEAGRMDLQPTTFALAETLHDAMALMRERATRSGVTLATEIDASVGLVEADERKLKQVLFNLLTNAVKFTPSGGRVTLAARASDEEIAISVADTGVGMSAQDQARLFEEFYQVGPGTTQEGTGLGLALTRRLVELHGGSIHVESAPGAGSTFTVTLPMRRPRASSAEKVVEAAAGTPPIGR